MTTTEKRVCGDSDVEAGRGGGQMGWYRFAAKGCTDKHVLDVGCGRGLGIPLLKQTARSVRGQDLDPRLASDEIMVGDIAECESKSFDVIVCVDVIEHIPESAATEFVKHLGRVAREKVFVSTPNWTASRCAWPFHVKEYVPREFYDLLATIGDVELFKGIPSGEESYPVRHRKMYDRMNNARNWGATAFATRVLNNVLPVARRIHSHNAAWVHLKNERD